jgi:hypothetical protein
VRDGKPDFLLLKRGDTWRDQSLGRFKSGQDAQHRVVIASYGDSRQRPRIELSRNLIDHNGHARSHLAIVGLHLVGYRMVPGAPEFTGADHAGFRLVGGGADILIEDCHIQYGGIVLQSFRGHRYDHIEVRRNVIEKSYHVDTCNQNFKFRPWGMYASHAHDVLIEENLWDHNGWNADVASACASMYNHNLYLNSDDLVVRGNLILRASSIGIKMRSDRTGDCSGVSIENNLFVDGEIGVSMGGNKKEAYRFTNSSIRDNVFSQIGMGNPTGRNFSGIVGFQDHDKLRVENNLFAAQLWYDNAHGLKLTGGTLRQSEVRNNTFYRLRRRSLLVEATGGWDSVTISDNTFVDPDQGSCLVDHRGGFGAVRYAGNHYSSSAAAGDWFCVGGSTLSLDEWKVTAEGDADDAVPTFTDPSRTLGNYAGTLGLSPTIEAFVAQARLQSRHFWRPEYRTAAVNDYIRAGFQ